LAKKGKGKGKKSLSDVTEEVEQQYPVTQGITQEVTTDDNAVDVDERDVDGVKRNTVWRCSCGEEWPETGDAEGLRMAMSHNRKMAAVGTPHKSIGLVDLNTGEVIVKGFSRVNAVRKGYIRRSTVTSDATKESPKSGEFARTRSVGPMRGTMPFMNIIIDPTLWNLFLVAAAKFGFELTPDHFSQWLVTGMSTLYVAFPKVFGVDKVLAYAIKEYGVPKAEEEVKAG